MGGYIWTELIYRDMEAANSRKVSSDWIGINYLVISREIVAVYSVYKHRLGLHSFVIFYSIIL